MHPAHEGRGPGRLEVAAALPTARGRDAGQCVGVAAGPLEMPQTVGSAPVNTTLWRVLPLKYEKLT
jgi:hypothetical protein